MDFEPSDEQKLLAASVERLMSDAFRPASRPAMGRAPEGWSRQVWASYAELGLLGLPFPALYGGFDGTGVDLMIVMEARGRALASEPYLATVILGGSLVALAGSAAQQAELLPEIAAGKLLLALAHGEARARYVLAHVETRATADGDGYRLSGQKNVVFHGDSADQLIVSARHAGAVSDETGISLFLVDRTAEGLTIRPCESFDGQRAAEVILDRVPVASSARLGVEGAAFAILDRVIDRANAALCAEAVGLMAALNQQTIDHLKIRRQFGVPLASFQALQHRMVEMVIEYEQARSMAILAALAADNHDVRERHRAISAAKIRVGAAGRFIGEQAIQLHGGIGMTDELAAGHYFKRLVAIERSFGDSEHHLDRFAAARFPTGIARAAC